ncbi:MAG: ABC transporter permease [Pseudomonadota bacterium]
MADTGTHPEQAYASPSSNSYVAPRRYGAVNWLGLQTLYVREVRRFLKVGMQTLFAPVLSALLFMLVFKLAFPDRPPIDGVSFADFLGPGVVMMAVLNNAFQNSSSSITIAKVQGNTSDFLMAPLSSSELTAGFIAGAATRGVLVGAVTLAVIAAMGVASVSVVHWWAVIFYSLIAAIFMGAVGLLGGVWAEKFDHLAVVTNFVILPLTMLSGTFYPIDALGEPFRSLSNFNPFFHLIDGFRYGFTGNAEGDLMFGASFTFIIAAASTIACWALFRSGYKLKA